MKLYVIFFAIGLFISTILFGQSNENIILNTITGEIAGTLSLPVKNDSCSIVILISGSGPTDRDGNNPMMKNNSLKMLSEELNKAGIASLRFDKRGIAASKSAGINEADLRFDNYVDDVISWIELIKSKNKFSKIILAGHSEGSLIGMIASRNKYVSAFISIAGAGQPADLIIKDQLKSQPPQVLEMCAPILDELAKGNSVNDVPQMLYSLFRPSVQPYMISWIKHDPRIELKKLTIPVLLIQGKNDFQVSVDNAKMLNDAKPDAKLVLIEGMNHILKNSETDLVKNMQTYNMPELPLNTELVNEITKFVLSK